MTTTAKLAISLPASLAARARRAVRRGQAASVSAYIAAALEEKVKLDDLGALLDEMLAETGGPLTAAERRRAERELGIKWPRRKK
jgi:Arc/MetJ-type ribon-helix-helix transcriptional regulator